MYSAPYRKTATVNIIKQYFFGIFLEMCVVVPLKGLGHEIELKYLDENEQL